MIYHLPNPPSSTSFFGPILIFEHGANDFEFRAIVEGLDFLDGGPALLLALDDGYVGHMLTDDTPWEDRVICLCSDNGEYRDVDPRHFRDAAELPKWRLTPWVEIGGIVFPISPFA